MRGGGKVFEPSPYSLEYYIILKVLYVGLCGLVLMSETRKKILSSLVDGKPLSARDIMVLSGLGKDQVYNGVSRAWRSGSVLRTRDPKLVNEVAFRGRGGNVSHCRPFHLYVLRPPGVDEVSIDGDLFVSFGEEFKDPRGGGSVSKASRVIDFLRDNHGEAFFSKDVVEALEEYGVQVRDVMPAVRRQAKKGSIYVRGYKTDVRQTPFLRGFLLTWIDAGKPRQLAINEALERTDARLLGEAAASPGMERIHRIRDIVLEHSRIKQLVSSNYMQEELGISRTEFDFSVGRVLDLYTDITEVKLFGAYRYYYHRSLAGEELNAAVAMKKNYVRIAKGRANRVGHNWEAVAEWFIDTFTSGARFWEQSHRTKRFDRRRITLYLIKGVGGRRRYAEMDRVWDVTPGILLDSITYVLSCKWGMVRKSHVDDFFEVLKWSKEFGVDTPEGREVKEGIIGVFAASRFNPEENVRLKDETEITLASYAARRKLQILTATDFNKKLRERGCDKQVSVQKVCKYSKNEDQVRQSLNEIWANPAEAPKVLADLSKTNEQLFEFEEMMEATA